jgi:agmatinase
MSHYEFPYRSQSTFLNVPPVRADGDERYAIAGVAYDGAVTNRPGARMAPAAIRAAAAMLCDGIHPLFDTTPIGKLCDAGDLAVPNTSLTAMREVLQKQAAALVASHHVAWLGGDHSITLPLLRAQRALHGRPLGVVHFDAHCDTWSDHFGEPSGHGTWMAEALAEGLVEPRAVVQIGLRSAGARPALNMVADRGGAIYTARDLRGLESPQQLGGIVGAIRQRMRDAGSPPVYLTLDIDCLDPAFAPGTGTPEPGGMTTSQVMTLIEELADLDWCGMDCVEVSPPYDHSQLTAQAAAIFVWTYLCGRIAREGAR